MIVTNNYMGPIFNFSISLISLATLMTIVFLFRDKIKLLLLWLESQEIWIMSLIFIGLFILVSFPCVWGYIILNLACGYLYGLLYGLIMVISTASVGVFFAHITIKYFMSRFIHNKFITGTQSGSRLKAVFLVLAGPNAFKVVMFTRLSPIPFGLQNAVFAVSMISTWKYMAATILGLLPTQIMNVYLGNTFRSMEDVLTDDSTAVVGWIMFLVQICIGVGLMAYVIHKAKSELQKTLDPDLKLQQDGQDISYYAISILET